MASACEELTEAEKYMFSKYLDTIVLWSFIIKLIFHLPYSNNEEGQWIEWTGKNSSSLE